MCFPQVTVRLISLPHLLQLLPQVIFSRKTSLALLFITGKKKNVQTSPLPWSLSTALTANWHTCAFLLNCLSTISLGVDCKIWPHSLHLFLRRREVYVPASWSWVWSYGLFWLREWQSVRYQQKFEEGFHCSQRATLSGCKGTLPSPQEEATQACLWWVMGGTWPVIPP